MEGRKRAHAVRRVRASVVKSVSDHAETQFKICIALFLAQKPLRVAEISRASGAGRQLVEYHLGELLRQKVVLPAEHEGATYYTLQPVFIRGELFEELLKPFNAVIEKMAPELIVADDELPGALKNNYTLLLELLDFFTY